MAGTVAEKHKGAEPVWGSTPANWFLLCSFVSLTPLFMASLYHKGSAVSSDVGFHRSDSYPCLVKKGSQQFAVAHCVTILDLKKQAKSYRFQRLYLRWEKGKSLDANCVQTLFGPSGET